MITAVGGLPLSLVGCSDDRMKTPIVGGGTNGGRPGIPDPCATPNEGCECATVGATAECGELDIREGDYVECSVGERTCLDDGTWGECVGSHVTTKNVGTAGVGRDALQLGTAVDCTNNPCNPYCKEVTDTGMGLSSLPAGVCTAPTGGIQACATTCGYGGPTGASYGNLNATWQRLPATCTTAMDSCDYDHDCVSGTCTPWTFPCYDPAPPGCMLTSRIDLEVGPPCLSGTTYHIPICNRGADRADTGTIKIGVYSNANRLTTCMTGASPPGAPDQGAGTFVLGTAAGRFIDPGKCIDVTPANISSGNAAILAGLSTRRAIGLNYDGTLAECNYCNNWHAFEPAVACTGCTGLQCSQTCAATTLTGRIMDPGGTNPLPGVVVYVPNGTVAPLVDGVACDTCSNLYSGTPIASAVTDYQGNFSLANAPAGVSFPLVIQTGRWRRQVTVPAITACMSAALATGETSRLPSKKSEGDIPKMALVMGAGDRLECLLRKIGLEDVEFTNRSGTGRVHLFTHNGMTFSGATAGVTGTGALYNSPTELDRYSAIIAPCDNNHVSGTLLNNLNTTNPPTKTISAAQQANVRAYIDKGGRLFSTHWMGFDFTHLNYPMAVNFVFGNYVDADREAPAFPYTIDQTNAVGSLFANWASMVGASPAGFGTVTFSSWRHLAASVNAGTTRIAYGDSTQPPVSHAAGSTRWGGPMVSMFTFDTPWGVPPASQCGRVVTAETHVSSGSGVFPGGCTGGAMTGQEEAFEFLVFNTTQCLGLVAPPAPISTLAPVTFVRDFQASCPNGTLPVWRFFSWQSVIPPGTSIEFRAQTADVQADLAAAPQVGAGTSTASTGMVWTSDPDTIDEHLQNDLSPSEPSRDWLRISARLIPSSAVSPTLTTWKQEFDCVPAE